MGWYDRLLGLQLFSRDSESSGKQANKGTIRYQHRKWHTRKKASEFWAPVWGPALPKWLPQLSAFHVTSPSPSKPPKMLLGRYLSLSDIPSRAFHRPQEKGIEREWAGRGDGQGSSGTGVKEAFALRHDLALERPWRWVPPHVSPKLREVTYGKASYDRVSASCVPSSCPLTVGPLFP